MPLRHNASPFSWTHGCKPGVGPMMLQVRTHESCNSFLEVNDVTMTHLSLRMTRRAARCHDRCFWLKAQYPAAADPRDLAAPPAGFVLEMHLSSGTFKGERFPAKGPVFCRPLRHGGTAEMKRSHSHSSEQTFIQNHTRFCTTRAVMDAFESAMPCLHLHPRDGLQPWMQVARGS